MENKINQTIILPNGDKHLILDQTIYNNTSYFLTCRINNENKFTKEFSIVEEIVDNNEYYVKTVKDQEILKYLLETFKKNLN